VTRTIGIAGFGVVGSSIARTFPEARVFDKYSERQEDLTGVDFLFVAVPTPWNGRELDCSEVEDVIATHEARLFVIRSATSVGFAQYLSEKYGKRIVVQPEYLGETPNHSMTNHGQPTFLLIGGDRRTAEKLLSCTQPSTTPRFAFAKSAPPKPNLSN
jgi:UDP-glucose 6-dehydrogenase